REELPERRAPGEALVPPDDLLDDGRALAGLPLEPRRVAEDAEERPRRRRRCEDEREEYDQGEPPHQAIIARASPNRDVLAAVARERLSLPATPVASGRWLRSACSPSYRPSRLPSPSRSRGRPRRPPG